jgi:nitroimidazol reductase NimA-like FMN-containing flavoprotein (pyridoxamine 5'-phosphate oxidase superfamily)
MKYRSVLACGKVELIEDPEEKIQIMNKVMKHYVPDNFTYSLPSMKEVCCWIVRTQKMEGKINGY